MRRPAFLNDLAERKAGLRRIMRGRLAGLDKAQRAAAASEIADKILKLPDWPAAAAVLAYHPLPGELDISPVYAAALAAGKRLALPRVSGDELDFRAVADPGRELAAGAFGVMEPLGGLPRIDPAAAPLLVLVPGLAFDPAGRRLGRGRGFYDRFLRGLRAAFADNPAGLSVVGVCFAAQLVESSPAGPRDERMDSIVSA